MRSTLAFLAMAGCFWGLQAWSLQQLSVLRRDESTAIIVPDERFAKATVTDYRNLAADMYWLLVLQRNGEQIAKDDERQRNYDGISKALDLLSDFDPRFHEASILGSWILADANLAPQAARLLKKGMHRFPDRWDYPFQLGFIQFLYLREYQAAGDMFMKASILPNSPAVSQRLAAGMYERSNKIELAITTWRNIYEHGHGNIKGIAKRALAKLGVTVGP